QEAYRHQQPRRYAGKARDTCAGDSEQDRGSKHHEQPNERSEEQRRRTIQLSISRASNHPADGTHIRIWTKRRRTLRKSEPNWTWLFQQTPKRTIVNDGGVYGANTTCGLQRGPTHQHATARRCRCATLRIVYPGKRIEHLKVVHERRNER